MSRLCVTSVSDDTDVCTFYNFTYNNDYEVAYFFKLANNELRGSMYQCTMSLVEVNENR